MNLFEKEIRKTRKIHRCEYCGRIIQKSESAKYVFFVDSGDNGSYYLCDWCNEYIKDIETRSQGYIGEFEFSYGDLHEHVREYLHGRKYEDYKVDTTKGIILITDEDETYELELVTLLKLDR